MTDQPFAKNSKKLTTVGRLAVFCVFALSAAYRTTFQPTVYADLDSWGYLFPALNGLWSGDFSLIFGRTYLYPAFLSVLLAFEQGFALISIAQQLSSFGAALLCAYCFLAVFQDELRIYSQNSIRIIVHAAIAAFCFLFLNSPAVVYYERLLRPEAIAPCLMAAYLLLCALYYRRGPSLPGKNTLFFGLCLANWALFYLKPNWGFAVASPAVIALAGSLLTRTRPTPKRIMTGLACYAAAFLIAFLPQHIFKEKAQDASARLFTYKLLFSWHADAVYGAIYGAINNDEPSSHYIHNKEITDDAAAMLQRCLEAPREQDGFLLYPSLPFNPERIMWGTEGLPSTKLYLADYKTQKSFYIYYFIASIKEDPLRYINKILSQLSIYYSFQSEPYERFRDASLTDWHEGGLALGSLLSLDEYSAISTLYAQQYQDYIEHMETLSTQRGETIKHYNKIFSVLNSIYPYSLVLAFVLYLAAALKCTLKKTPIPAKTPMALCITAFLLAFLVDLTSATMHSLDVTRFFEFHLLLTLFVHIMALTLILAAAARITAVTTRTT